MATCTPREKVLVLPYTYVQDHMICQNQLIETPPREKVLILPYTYVQDHMICQNQLIETPLSPKVNPKKNLVKGKNDQKLLQKNDRWPFDSLPPCSLVLVRGLVRSLAQRCRRGGVWSFGLSLPFRGHFFMKIISPLSDTGKKFKKKQ